MDRPHAFLGRLSDACCTYCGREAYGSHDLHSPEAVHVELQRLWKLEDAFLQIQDEPFHRLTITPDAYFITHPLSCRARGLHLCHHQSRMTRHLQQGFPLPEVGDYRYTLSGTGSSTQLNFEAIPVRASCT